MKKLMFAVAMAAAMTASADITCWFNFGDATKTAVANSCCYLFYGDATALAGFKSAAATDFSAALQSYSGSLVAKIDAMGNPDKPSFDYGENVDIFLVAVKGEYGKDGYFCATGVMDSTSLKNDWQFGAAATPGNWVTAANVPEPTSALLMLLGMAGRALRRKQA